ncbi:hypothetical protein AS188_15740 (plasmid) [Kocuria flava]|uniref:Short-chain dehydrogenase n=1 Tax=Kocuria flava TaxID=446860 RepID=A0A0U3I0Y7_9MICC|nr:SDR family NAD(P)-dependent oxidoreductase [Kocuria flava]ALU41344.1 hypothetical protein AS188_15740 [Kocuria flava]GEO93187.1 short-chain dehydrogenase [Kocuria flava]
MTSSDIPGKVVLITGGGQGIAAATATTLAARGALVSLVDRDPEALRSTLLGLGPEHHGVIADVTDSPSLDHAVQSTIDRFGRIDSVFACAGIGSASTVAASEVEALLRIIDVNLNGVIRTVKATLPEITKQRGHYLLMSSAAALKHMPRANAYAASKAGVEAFGGALRLELAHKGVSVGVAHPAWVATGMITGSGTRTGDSKTLPWPFNVVSTAEACADRLTDAIEQRHRKVFIPRSLAAMDVLRWLSTGPLWDRRMRAHAAATTMALEQTTSPISA